MAGLPVTSLQFSTLPTQALPNVTINLPVPIAASPSIMQLTCAAALAKVGEELDKIDLQNLLKNTNNQESNIQHIPDIIKAINSDNKEFAETICKDDGLSTESNIQHNSDIIKAINSDNKEFAETICKNDGLSTESNIQHNSDIIKTANGVLKKK